MKVIGLTGGIGSGKSTVSTYLRKKGIEIVDCDLMAHQMTRRGGSALPEIKKVFSDSVFINDELDRKALANIVFNDEEKRKQLEEITTKIIKNECIKLINMHKEKDDLDIFVIDAPLLFEFEADLLCDETWLVTCDLNTKIKRIMERDKTSEEEIIKRIESQLPDEVKMKMADKVIDNSRDLSWLYSQVDDLI